MCRCRSERAPTALGSAPEFDVDVSACVARAVENKHAAFRSVVCKAEGGPAVLPSSLPCGQ